MAVIRAYGRVIRAYGSVIRAYGRVIRAYGRVIRAYGSVMRAYGIYQNPGSKCHSGFFPCMLKLAHVAWGDTVRSTGEIGGSHLLAKCAITLVLICSTIQLCSNQQKSFVLNQPPILSLK